MPQASTAKSVQETQKKGCGCRKGNCSTKNCGCVKKITECNKALCKCLVESCQNRTNKAAAKNSKPESRAAKKKSPKDVASTSKSPKKIEKFSVKDSSVTSRRINKRVPRSIFSPESSPDALDKVKKTVGKPRAEKKTFSEKKPTETKIPATRSQKKARVPNNELKGSLKKNGSVEQSVPEKKSKRGLRRSLSVNDIDQIAYRTRSRRKLNFMETEDPDFSSNKSLLKTNHRKRKSASISDFSKVFAKEKNNLPKNRNPKTSRKRKESQLEKEDVPQGLRKSVSTNDLTRTTRTKVRKLSTTKEPSAEKGNSFLPENRKTKTKKKESVSETRTRRNQVKSFKQKVNENGSSLRKDSDEEESLSKSREEIVSNSLRMSPSTGAQPKSKTFKKSTLKKANFLKVPDAQVEYSLFRVDNSNFPTTFQLQEFRIRSKVDEKNKTVKETNISRRKLLNPMSLVTNIEKPLSNQRRSHSMNDIDQMTRASGNTKLSHSSKETEAIPSTSNRNQKLPLEYSSAVEQNPGTEQNRKRKSVEDPNTINKKKGKLGKIPSVVEDSSDEVFKPSLNSTKKAANYEESDSDSDSLYGELPTLSTDEVFQKQNNLGRHNQPQVSELQAVAQREPESRAMEINLSDESREWEDTP